MSANPYDFDTDPEALLRQEAARFGLKVTSARRSPQKNQSVGGAKKSYHLSGRALDIAGDPARMKAFAEHIATSYGDRVSELFYDPIGGIKHGKKTGAIGGHSDHVHVAWGGPLPNSSPQMRPQIQQPSVLDSMLAQQGPPDLYDEIVSEVMTGANIDRATAERYLRGKEGKKRYPGIERVAPALATDNLQPDAARTPQSVLERFFGGQTTTTAPAPGISSETPAAPQQAAPQVTPRTVSRRTQSAPPTARQRQQNELTIFNARVSQLDSEIDQMAATRQRMKAAGMPDDSMARFDSAMFEKSKERARLQAEIAGLTSRKASTRVDPKTQLSTFEKKRNEAQRAAVAATDERERARLYDEARQYQQRAEAAKGIIETEERGGAVHPMQRDVLTRPVEGRPGPSRYEQLAGGVGAGVAAGGSHGAYVASKLFTAAEGTGPVNDLILDALAAAGVDDKSLMEASEYLKQLSAISAEGAGPGLTPALASALAELAITYPLFRGASGLGRAAGQAVAGGRASTVAPVLGEAAALGGLGVAGKAGESNEEIAKAAALNALLPVISAGFRGFSAPTRAAGEFAGGYVPASAMNPEDQRAAFIQGLMGAALGTRRGPDGAARDPETGRADPETARMMRDLHDEITKTYPERSVTDADIQKSVSKVDLQQTIEQAPVVESRPEGQIVKTKVEDPAQIDDLIASGYEIIKYRRKEDGIVEYYAKSPRTDALYPVDAGALAARAKDRYKPIEMEAPRPEPPAQPGLPGIRPEGSPDSTETPVKPVEPTPEPTTRPDAGVSPETIPPAKPPEAEPVERPAGVIAEIPRGEEGGTNRGDDKGAARVPDEGLGDVPAVATDAGGAAQGKRIEAEAAPTESPKLVALRSRFEDAQAKQRELLRRKAKGENISLELNEQNRLTRKLANELKIAEAYERRNAGAEGARQKVREIFEQGETPKISDLTRDYRITYDEAREIIGEGARQRIEENHRQPAEGTATEPKPNRYAARDLQDQITPKQTTAIRKIVEPVGVDADALVRERYGVENIHQLNKQTGLRFISDLKKMAPDQLAALRTKEGSARKQEPAVVTGARKRLRDAIQGKKLSANPLDTLVDTAIVTGYDIYKTTKDFAAWSKQMVGRVGEKVRPHLENTWHSIRLSEFADRHAQKTDNTRQALSLGKVQEANAQAVKDATGIDISGYERVVDNFSIRHIFKKHGNQATEAPRGQEAVSVADIAKIPEIVAAPDAIERAPDSGQNTEAIRYSKRYNGVTYFVEEVRTGRKHLVPKSMYKRVATNTAKNASSDTSETLRDPNQSLPESIPQKRDTEGGFLRFGGKPDLLTLARFHTAEGGRKGYNKFKLEAAKHGYDTKSKDFGDAWDKAQDMPPITSAKDIALDLINAPRTLKSSMDLSAPLRQGAILSLSHPFLATKAGWQMIRALRSKNHEQFKAELDFHPRAKQAEDAGLYIANREGTDAGKKGKEAASGITEREEAFMSKLIGKTPIVGHLIKGSERTYTTFLDKLRIDVFDSYAQQIEKAGGSAKDFEVAANWINNATGRGKIWKPLEGAAPLLNGLLFSPRFLASRIHVLNPRNYYKMYKESPVVAKTAIKDMAKFLGVVGMTLTLAKMNGAEVSLDPEEADFLKIKVGNTRYDLLAGLQQEVRAGYRAALGFIKTARGKKVENKDKAIPVLTAFMRNKLAPVPGYLWTAAEGTNPIGKKFEPGKDALELIYPLIVKDMYDAYKEEGWMGAAKTTPAIVGIGTSTYKKKSKPMSLRELGIEF